MLASEHTKAGVKIIAKESVAQIIGDSAGNVKGIKLASGKVIDADLVIMGSGVTPNTEFLASSGVKIQADGGLECNPFL